MKFALAYQRSKTWPKWDWVSRAFLAEGHEVAHVETLADLGEADEWADAVLFAQSTGGLEGNAVANLAPERRSLWVEWVFDLLASQAGTPLEFQPKLSKYRLRELRAMDLVLVKERGLLPDYQELGINAEWFDQGCPSALGAVDHAAEKRWDVLVWGSDKRSWGHRRADVRALVDAGLRVAWAGRPSGAGRVPGVESLPFVPTMELPALAGMAAIVLDVPMRDDVDGYWSDKLWLVLGMGACHLRRWSPGLPGEGFGPCYMTYRDRPELLDKAQWLVDHAEFRCEMGGRARRWVRTHHTYERRIRYLARLIEGERRCVPGTSCVSAAVAAV